MDRLFWRQATVLRIGPHPLALPKDLTHLEEGTLKAGLPP